LTNSPPWHYGTLKNDEKNNELKISCQFLQHFSYASTVYIITAVYTVNIKIFNVLILFTLMNTNNFRITVPIIKKHDKVQNTVVD